MGNGVTQSVDQVRAAKAWGYLSNGSDEAQCSKEFANLAKGAPALIMSNGLMQTLAFYEQKGGEALAVSGYIRAWLSERFGWPKEFGPLMKKLTGCDSDTYMRATEEALQILRWIRQFASAVAK